MADSDLERQALEAEALLAIYPDGVFWSEGEGVWHALVSDASTAPRVELALTIPENYPSAASPGLAIEAPDMTREYKEQLLAQLDELSVEMRGCEVAHTLIEHAREYVAANCAVTVAEPAGAREDHGTASALSANESAQETPAGPVPHIHAGEPLTDRKSTFQAFAARCYSEADVRRVVQHLLSDRKIARATHNMVAWRVWDEQRRVQLHDNDDDGEAGAGVKMAELLHLMRVNNLVVMVSRWYGGIHLGSDRWRHIVATARQCIEDAGLFKADDEADAAR